MPDLYAVHDAAKVRCFAPADAIDGLATPAGALRGRIAPDEVVFVGAPGTAATMVAHCEGALAPLGARALVVDHTDGWSFFTIAGPGAEDVFCRVSMVPLPDAAEPGRFFMGRVCDVATKAFRRPGRIDIMTGMETTRHVMERLEHAGHGVGLHVTAAPEHDPVGVAS